MGSASGYGSLEYNALKDGKHANKVYIYGILLKPVFWFVQEIQTIG